jgi:hypothetical protein
VLVYADRSETADPRERLDGLRAELAAIARMPPSIERHGKLVSALIEAGRLLQGAADQDAETGPLGDFVHRLAKCVVRSWDSRFGETGELPLVPAVELPRWIELRVPEGFAFYGVYPEAYADSARRLNLSGPPQVIGIRSIGTTLGAVVAAALDAPPPITVRPFGDPLARRVELPLEVLDGSAHYVVVDEGPGLSGSSFGAVADWLEERGVPLKRIAFVPSHRGGLGPGASEAHRRRWSMAQRVAAEFDPSWLRPMFGPLENLRGGRTAKFLAGSGDERVLIKFAGLGAMGERKLAMARALHSAGFAPEPLRLVHGFLAQRWCDGRAIDADEKPVEKIGRYIGARARLFPADDAEGASIEELLKMCRRNIALALGEEAASALGPWNAAALQARVARVRTDNRLDRGKWLRLPGGRLLKTDALDHHCAHDLIGCQDMAWDVVGATAEFDLDAGESERLIAATGQKVDRELLEFYGAAYLAFRMGKAMLAGDGQAATYADRLRQHLHHCGATRPESLVG